MPRRWILILILAPLYVGIMSWLATFLVALIVRPSDWLEIVAMMFSPAEWDLNDDESWFFFVLPAAVISITQFIFLIPVMPPRPLHRGRSHSLKWSMISAGLISALLTTGLALGVIGLFQSIGSSIENKPPEEVTIFREDILGWLILAFAATSWITWSVLLIRFTKTREGRHVIDRLVGILLGGTIAEILVVLPVDIMIRRKTDCYCATGTFWTLTFSAWSLLWLTGPGIVLALTSKRRRFWAEKHCIMCGYEKGPSPSGRCPECGYEWAQKVAQPASTGRATNDS